MKTTTLIKAAIQSAAKISEESDSFTPTSQDSSMENLDLLSRDIDDALQDQDTLLSTQASLESLAEILDGCAAEALTPLEAQLAHQNFTTLLGQIGLPAPAVVSQEGVGVQFHVSSAQVGQIAKAVWEAIKKAWQHIKEMAKVFFAKLMEVMHGIEGRAQRLIERLKKVAKDIKGPDKVEIGAILFNKLQKNGKVDNVLAAAREVAHFADQLTTVNAAVTESNKDGALLMGELMSGNYTTQEAVDELFSKHQLHGEVPPFNGFSHPTHGSDGVIVYRSEELPGGVHFEQRCGSIAGQKDWLSQMRTWSASLNIRQEIDYRTKAESSIAIQALTVGEIDELARLLETSARKSKEFQEAVDAIAAMDAEASISDISAAVEGAAGKALEDLMRMSLRVGHGAVQQMSSMLSYVYKTQKACLEVAEIMENELIKASSVVDATAAATASAVATA